MLRKEASLSSCSRLFYVLTVSDRERVVILGSGSALPTHSCTLLTDSAGLVLFYHGN
jgi:hypothetical protein